MFMPYAMSNHFLENIICSNQPLLLVFIITTELKHPSHHMMQSQTILISRSMPTHQNLFVLKSTFIPPNNH